MHAPCELLLPGRLTHQFGGFCSQGAAGRVGLLVSERMINCPVQAVPMLHQALVEDIAWAVENEVCCVRRQCAFLLVFFYLIWKEVFCTHQQPEAFAASVYARIK